MKRPPPTERDLVRTVLGLCQHHPTVAAAIRLNAGRVRLAGGRWLTLAPAYWPDVIGFTKLGQFLGIECKAEAAARSDHRDRQEKQNEWMAHARGNGCAVVTVRTPAELAEFLDRLRR